MTSPIHHYQFYKYGKLAQLVEHSAVNRSVGGPSPSFPANGSTVGIDEDCASAWKVRGTRERTRFHLQDVEVNNQTQLN